MIGLTCEICGERFDVAVQEGPSRDIEAADWVAAHTCGGRILADDGEVIRRAFALGDHPQGREADSSVREDEMKSKHDKRWRRAVKTEACSG